MWNLQTPQPEDPSGDGEWEDFADLEPPEDSADDDEWEEFKQGLINDFADWLDELDGAQLPGDVPPPADRPDLMSFYRELAALRQDVQIQSKNSHNVARKLDTVSSELNQQSSELGATVERLKSEIPQARRNARKDVCAKILELVEAVQRTADQDLEITLPRILLSQRKRQDAVSALRQPLQRLQRQADSAMTAIGITSTASIGATFDAKTMRAVSQSQSGARPGSITEVIRQGYMLDGDVIQLAEVQVERHKESEK